MNTKNNVSVSNIYDKYLNQALLELEDPSHQTVAMLFFKSVHHDYPHELLKLGLELWCNYCENRDPLVHDETSYASALKRITLKTFKLNSSIKQKKDKPSFLDNPYKVNLFLSAEGNLYLI